MTEGVNIPPQGCLHECLAYLVAIIVTVILCLCFHGCKTVQPIQQTRDSVRVEIRHDSVFVFKHDSIFRDRWRSGDTVFVTVERLELLHRHEHRIA